MTENDKSPHPSYDNTLKEETLNFLKLWAGEPGNLLKETLPGESKDATFSLDRQYLFSETIFLADRNAEEHQARERKHICEDIAVQSFPLERIFAPTEIDELEQSFYEISSLQTMHHNQTISVDHKLKADFNDEGGTARLNLIKFFLIKRMCCILDGKNLTIETRNKSLVNHKEIRLKHLELEISNLLREAFAICVDDQVEKRDFQERIMKRALQADDATSFPTEAPELYVDRKDETEPPAKFLMRVYKKWAKTGLTRRSIGNLDPTLIRALYREDIPVEIDQMFPKSPGGRPKKSRSLEEEAAARKKRREANREQVRKHRERKRNPQ